MVRVTTPLQGERRTRTSPEERLGGRLTCNSLVTHKRVFSPFCRPVACNDGKVIYQKVCRTFRVNHVYWQFYQVPLMLICLDHFCSFFIPTPNSVVRNSRCPFYTLRSWWYKIEMTQNKVARVVALNVKLACPQSFGDTKGLLFC